MSFPRYPKYKASGVEWLGEVPEHWETAQLRHFVDIENGTDHKHVEQDEGFPVYGSGGVFAYASDFLYNGESVLLGRKGTINKPLYVNGPFWTVDTMYWTRIRPNTSGRYAYYAATTFPFDLYATNTALPSMTKGVLNGHVMARPPLPEQTAIGEFLDRETGKIDGLVAEQRRLMELLKEKRQAAISHAVTKGLNPHAPMKPSGIEWLGDVPEHWDCVRNKVVFEEISERSISEEGELMTVSHITGVTPRSQKDVNMFLAETLDGYKKCRRGDLVINTMWAWMGALGCSPCDGLVSPAYNIYRPRNARRLSPAYYDYLCRLPAHVVTMKANSTGVWESRLRLYPDAFLSMRLPVPPLKEQLSIVEYLSIQTAEWDTLTAEAQRAIDLLQERRTALISAAVTGQIDVREQPRN
jgi:type I restriction enzyme S subunit